MSADVRRSRSTTGVSQRPLSRDSTASLQSGPQLHRANSISQYSNHAHGQTAYAPQHSQPRTLSMTSQPQYDQFTVLQALPQHQQNFPQPQHSHGLPMQADPSQQYQHQHHPQAQMQYHSHSIQQQSFTNAPVTQPGVDVGQYGHSHSTSQSNMALQPQHHAPTDEEGTKKPRGGGAAATQSNEKELREALEKNKGRSLKDVAREVVDTDRTSRAEKTKQLFAMLWLQGACETAKTSVPRSRVYASYADRCATEKVSPLNPASFGKLVRIIFKGIQTRRLGVRGESKYHYVDLALKSEKEQNENLNGRPAFQEPQSPSSMAIDFNNVPTLHANAPFGGYDGSPIASPVLAPRRDLGQCEGAVFAEPYTDQHQSRYHTRTYPQELSFPSPEDEVLDADVDLPDLWPYAPENADEDAANGLRSLYRSHCTSLIEYFKKCKEKQFWRTFAQFQGTLTVPNQKLLTSPSMAAWVRECDFYMYQRMLSYLTRLTLQVLPVAALTFFDSIVRNLNVHIVKTFQGMPAHVVEARLEPATRFTELINRMLKVNNAAHAASQVLENDQGRENLLADWNGMVNVKRLMESELPGCGYEETHKILTQDMVALLRPLTPPQVSEGEDGLPYANAEAPESNDNYIDRIDTLLRSLPMRFPHASARTIVNCVKLLSSGAMRDFTMQGAQTFHAWWIVKVFIDEYSQWLITSGGFLAHRPGRRGDSSPALSGPNGAASEAQSRLGSLAPAADDMEIVNGTTKSLGKRKSTEFDTDDLDANAKKQRLTPETTDDTPVFEQQHASFVTSFGAETPAPLDEHEMDDSGIGMGLLGSNDEGRVTRSAKKSRIDTAPLMQFGGDVEGTAIAI